MDEIAMGTSGKSINYGKRNGVNFGETVLAMLLTNRKYCVNVKKEDMISLFDSISEKQKNETNLETEGGIARMMCEVYRYIFIIAAVTLVAGAIWGYSIPKYRKKKAV